MIFEAKYEYLLKRSLLYEYLNNNPSLENLIDDLNIIFINFLVVTNDIYHQIF
jgi:hypothetical protein